VTRHVGRVKVNVQANRGVAAVTSGPDPTASMPQRPQPVPIFVDDSGRRRRRVRHVIVFGPLLDLLTLYGTVFLDRWITLAGWLAVMVLQTVTAILAFRLDREPLRPLWALALQQVVYRQIMYLVLLQSIVTALTGRRLRWHTLRRTGVVAADTA
jgi:hypothetical protein